MANGTIATSFGNIRQVDPRLQARSFRNVEDLIRSRSGAAQNILQGGLGEQLRLTEEAILAATDPLREFGDLTAFEEQSALLGLGGPQAQQAAIEGIQLSPAQQEAERVQTESLRRQLAATGDIAGGFGVQQAQQLGGGQALARIQDRLGQLEPLVGIARGTRGRVADIEESNLLRQAGLTSQRGAESVNLRLQSLLPSIQSRLRGTELRGLKDIGRAQRQGQIISQLGGLAGGLSSTLGL